MRSSSSALVSAAASRHGSVWFRESSGVPLLDSGAGLESCSLKPASPSVDDISAGVSSPSGVISAGTLAGLAIEVLRRFTGQPVDSGGNAILLAYLAKRVFARVGFAA